MALDKKIDELERKKTVLEIQREALQKGYELTLSTIGASMFPLLSSRDKVTIVKCDCEELKTGDLILFKSPNNKETLVAHRLIRKIKNENGYTFITKGDATLSYDQPLSQENIIGKIIKIKKRDFVISLEGIWGKIINKSFLLFSLMRINYFTFILFRKLKSLSF